MTRNTTIRALYALGLAAAIFTGPTAFAENARQPAGYMPVGYVGVKVDFRYLPWESPAENYRTLRGLVRRACTIPGFQPLSLKLAEKACARDMLDKGIAQLGRRPIADLHFAATGRRVMEIQLASTD